MGYMIPDLFWARREREIGIYNFTVLRYYFFMIVLFKKIFLGL